jgi:hypothetical protein
VFVKISSSVNGGTNFVDVSIRNRFYSFFLTDESILSRILKGSEKMQRHYAELLMQPKIKSVLLNIIIEELFTASKKKFNV